VSVLVDAGVGLTSGVPCSHLGLLLDEVLAPDGRLLFVPATNEGDAVAVAAGAAIAGLRSTVLMQNSGLGNAVSPLTSLTHPFRLPMMLVVSWRGCPDGPPDEPQHGFMGAVTPRLLDLLDIPWRVAADVAGLPSAVQWAAAESDTRRAPTALLVRPGSLGTHRASHGPAERRFPRLLVPFPRSGPATVGTRGDLLEVVLGATGPKDVLVATTGYTSRDLFRHGDRPGNLYIVGSMGCASAVALGLALSLPERRVVVLDGDGAALMRLGMVPLIGHMSPSNLVHVVLDNAAYDSTGAQPCVGGSTDLAAVAAASGYRKVDRPASRSDLADTLMVRDPGPHFVHVLTEPEGGAGLPRPSLHPGENTVRFQSWLAS
jgi:phosphonopyruvate decarboxylase